MKKINLMKYIALGILSLGVLSCNIDDDNNVLIPFEAGVVENPETISQIAIANPELSLFEQALRRIETESNNNIISRLNIPGASTVFAPSDAAFNTFLNDNGIDGIENLPRVTLENIINNHVLDAEILDSNLTTGFIKTNSVNSNSNANVDLYVDTTNGVLLNGNTRISTPNVEANNGVIHIVDRVLRVPTVFNLISLESSFSSLLEAINIADSAIEDDTTPISDILGDLGTQFTLFAPNNAAFQNILAELEVSSLAEVNPAMLRGILLTHIINRNSLITTNPRTANLRSRNNRTLSVNFEAPPEEMEMEMESEGMEMESEEMEVEMDVELDFTVTDPNGRIANVVTDGIIDIQGENGVFQEIDIVLLP